MKRWIKPFVAILNRGYLRFSCAQLRGGGNRFYGTRLQCRSDAAIHIDRAELKRVAVRIPGEKCRLEIKGALLHRSRIEIYGSGNSVVIGPEVVLQNVTIIVKGNRCSVSIGKGTLFGGGRIVNAGQDNSVAIGEGCLFSDQIEIWASDTHDILDREGTVLNPCQPIRIEDRVWVGSRVIILKGVTLAAGSVIGMGSVVTRDVDAFTIAVGNPNRSIRSDIRWRLES